MSHHFTKQNHHHMTETLLQSKLHIQHRVCLVQTRLLPRVEACSESETALSKQGGNSTNQHVYSEYTLTLPVVLHKFPVNMWIAHHRDVRIFLAAERFTFNILRSCTSVGPSALFVVFQTGSLCSVFMHSRHAV